MSRDAADLPARLLRAAVARMPAARAPWGTAMASELDYVEGRLQRPAALALRIGVLLVVAVMWAGLVNDQLPCFLGTPNCD